MSLNTILATTPNTTTNYILKATGTSIGNSLIYSTGVYTSIGTTSTHGNLTIEQTTGESGLVINSSIAQSPTLYLRDAGSVGYSTIVTNNKLYINSSNVGIGTSSPSGKFEVLLPAFTNEDTDSQMAIFGSGSGGRGVRIGYSQANSSGYIYSLYPNVSWQDLKFAANNMIFCGGGSSERMRITSGGYVKQSYNGSYINTSGLYNEFTNNASGEPGIITTINGASIADATVYMASYETDHNNTTAQFFRGRGANTTRIRIYSNGNIQNTNGSYGTLSSDLRLKENINEANPKLNDILKLRVVNFNLIEDVTKKKQIGFIAQEFQEVFPSLVQISDTREYDEDGNVIKGLEDSLSLNVGMEFAILVKAIQELNYKVEAQQQQINQLINK